MFKIPDGTRAQLDDISTYNMLRNEFIVEDGVSINYLSDLSASVTGAEKISVDSTILRNGRNTLRFIEPTAGATSDLVFTCDF